MLLTIDSASHWNIIILGKTLKFLPNPCFYGIPALAWNSEEHLEDRLMPRVFVNELGLKFN